MEFLVSMIQHVSMNVKKHIVKVFHFAMGTTASKIIVEMFTV